MKKILIFLIALLLTVPVMAQEQTENMFFGGINYDESVVMAAGIAMPLGKSLYSFTYTNVGEYGSISTEIGYMINLGGLYIAPLAGANVDWLETESELPVVAYLVGASGLVAGVDVTEKVGFWGYGKYKFKLENDILYQDGYAFGGGLFLRF